MEKLYQNLHYYLPMKGSNIVLESRLVTLALVFQKDKESFKGNYANQDITCFLAFNIETSWA